MFRLVRAYTVLAVLPSLALSITAPKVRAGEAETISALRSIGVHITTDDALPGRPPVSARIIDDGAGGDRTSRYAPIQTLRSLRELDLTGFGVDDRYIEYLSGLPELESVSLVHTAVTDRGIERLGTHTKLKHLRLSFNYQVTDRGMVLYETQITKTKLEAFREARPEINVRY
jgi:hypothetical protein